MGTDKPQTASSSPNVTLFNIQILLVSLQEVYVHILDLSETKKVWEFAEAFKRKYKALNVLVSDMSYLHSCIHIHALCQCR